MSALLDAEPDPAVRAAVLSGEGKAFCAGLDWLSFLGAGDLLTLHVE